MFNVHSTQRQYDSTFPDFMNMFNTGHWVVPCTDCKTGEGCTWSRATWQPVGCSYQQFSRRRLQQCLRGRKLLFIGDSTNRGIANYIIEQTNDTLHDWDKTHTTRLYQNVNNNRTQVAFSYYPHFWLPVTHRPSFKKVLYQLFKRYV
ncbi:hypothetical protein DPMN_000511 [Dreissena polymorpha]|uniref:NXPE C-terminal domain-containing protein n=1 Tax=Dreissena polymorpha TaxID=45954 RepID=A0A9D4MGT4_DREPO|nr:hypothetical protein DPMN_000511 [Dreissena polymorpha]